MLLRSSSGRPENVLTKSRNNLPGTSLERQIKTSPGRQFRTSPGGHIRNSTGRHIVASSGWSNRIFRGRRGDVGGEVPGASLKRLNCHNISFKLFLSGTCQKSVILSTA